MKNLKGALLAFILLGSVCLLFVGAKYLDNYSKKVYENRTSNTK